jgi:hypothetical protein
MASDLQAISRDVPTRLRITRSRFALTRQPRLLEAPACSGIVSLDTKFGKRKSVNMSEDIARELNRLANLQRKTFFSLVNEIGLFALEADKNGFTLEEAVTAKKLVQRAKRSRMVLVNQDLWYFASSQALKASKNKWLKLLRDSAQWQANVFLVGSSDADFVQSLRRLLADFFWDCGEVRLEEVDGGEGLSLRLAFVPEMPLGHTQGLLKTLEGMFNSHGYLVTGSMVEPGFMDVAFKKVSHRLTTRQ